MFPSLPSAVALDTNSDVQRQNDTGIVSDNTESGLAYSPPYYPSPWMDPDVDGWQDAYAQAKAFVSELTLLEKVNLTTGTGCV